MEEQLADVGAVEPSELEEPSSVDADDAMSTSDVEHSHCSGDTRASPPSSEFLE